MIYSDSGGGHWHQFGMPMAGRSYGMMGSRDGGSAAEVAKVAAGPWRAMMGALHGAVPNSLDEESVIANINQPRGPR